MAHSNKKYFRTTPFSRQQILSKIHRMAGDRDFNDFIIHVLVGGSSIDFRGLELLYHLWWIKTHQ